MTHFPARFFNVFSGGAAIGQILVEEVVRRRDKEVRKPITDNA